MVGVIRGAEGRRLRVVAHVDMDAFYAQVEQGRDPSLQGKPVAVVQYNPHGEVKTVDMMECRIKNDSNGSIIAVSYQARPFGVKRQMMGRAARAVCPQLQLVQVPTKNCKADLTLYRESGARVVSILGRGGTCQRASIDEAYVDLTDQATDLLSRAENDPIEWAAALAQAAGSWVAGSEQGKRSDVHGEQAPPNQPEALAKDGAVAAAANEAAAAAKAKEAAAEDAAAASAAWLARGEQEWTQDERLLVCGAAIVAKLRAAVLSELDYTCSAGISHNKMLAKMASAMHKPSQQTLCPSRCLTDLLRDTPISKIGGLGGKLGASVCETLGITTLGELSQQAEPTLRRHFGDDTAAWLLQVSQGEDHTPVKERERSKSVGCSKTFFREMVLVGPDKVGAALVGLASELSDRLALEEEQNRTARRLVVHFRAKIGNSEPRDLSRRCGIRGNEDAAKLAAEALAMVRSWAASENANTGFTVDSLGLSAERFEERLKHVPPITRFFAAKEAAATKEVATTKEVAGGAMQPCAGASVAAARGSEEVSEPVSGAGFSPAVQQEEEGRADERETAPRDSGGAAAAAAAAAPAEVVQVGSTACAPDGPPFELDPSQVDQSVLKELPPSLRRQLERELGLNPKRHKGAGENRAGGGSLGAGRKQSGAKRKKPARGDGNIANFFK